jgi:phage baseplate assembly protein W
MSTLEKNLYKRVKVERSQTEKRPAASSTYRSISTVNPAADGFKLYDLAVIKQDIINHFHIRQGEKLENPEFGTIIWDVLFDPLTENLKLAIVENVESIINYDPRVQVDQVIVDEYESGLLIECVLIYLDYSIAETMRLQFDQASGLLS